MSKTVFTIADPHFFHNGVCIFERHDKTGKLRPWTDPQQMTEDLVSNWNGTVKQHDKVYVAGDLLMKRNPDFLEVIGRLNGDKVLIAGNHDLIPAKEYLKYFRDVRACCVWDKSLITHIPIHPDSVHRWEFNVHGHLHSDYVRASKGSAMYDPRYICISMEQPWTNFRPVEWSELMKIARKRREELPGMYLP